MREISVCGLKAGGVNPPILIAGPCVIEDVDRLISIAGEIKEISSSVGIPFIFKASYDKANRSSISSFRGPGIKEGLKALEGVKHKLGVPILSDVHSLEEVSLSSGILDVIQIPALLCRQTDLILAAARTGKTVNIKKGQFLSPWEMKNIIEKIESTGNKSILLTERGTSFGYNNLVVDMRGIPIMKTTGYPVIFDATHSVQLPGAAGSSSSGQPEFVSVLARAAVAAGCDGLFLEVHPSPKDALCDGPNMIDLAYLKGLLSQVMRIYRALKDDG
ncbi:MAG: 3-deoxy-8-phosphooctulonate synthase [Nitrospirae bacterium]|nr:3-deoxy-8-phosphooctulonate synthase [Nitrospirota bacterium]